MAPRRAREQRLVLEPREQRHRQQLLSKSKQRGFAATAMPSQRRLLVGPLGRTVAYVAGKVLIVRDRAGRVRMLRGVTGDFRYSADGRYLAALRRSKRGVSLRVLDVRASRWRTLADLPTVSWMEWSKQGPLVGYYDRTKRARVLRLFPLSGRARTIASHSRLNTRFFSAVRGERVSYIIGREVYVADVRRPSAARVIAKYSRGYISNGDMSPDGRELALFSGHSLERYALSGKRWVATTLARKHTVHSVWYRRDGALAWATPWAAHLLRAGRTRTFRVKRERIATMRLHRRSDALIIVTKRRARLVTLSAARPVARLLARAPKGSTLLSTDDYEGGTVLWTAKKIPYTKTRAQQLSQLRRKL